MGLDMYLYAEKYVSRNDFNKPLTEGYGFEPNAEFQAIVDTLHVDNKLIENSDHAGLSIDIPIGYWRKANQIHGWIVDNCAGGVDECQRISMSREQLQVLLDTCKFVMTTKETSLLPPAQGFFFGSSEIDEYYWYDIERTIKIVEDALATDNDYFYYRASW